MYQVTHLVTVMIMMLTMKKTDVEPETARKIKVCTVRPVTHKVGMPSNKTVLGGLVSSLSNFYFKIPIRKIVNFFMQAYPIAFKSMK
jgi:hypothetical protein